MIEGEDSAFVSFDEGDVCDFAPPRTGTEQALTSSISFITPSYRGDFSRSTLLFESMDKHARSYERHYVIVHDEDYALFAPYHRGRREILPASRFLPDWLHQMPAFIRWRGRRYMWSLKALPVFGWHTQQLVKIAAAATLPETRFCLVDSDNAFFRPFDVARLASDPTIPLYVEPKSVVDEKERHTHWVKVAHRVLGLAPPGFPADDYIGQIIVWDKATVQAMIRRIESATGQGWAQALCRAHSFSEYMIYGSFVMNDAEQKARHVVTSQSFCQAHWDLSNPDRKMVLGMMRQSLPHQVALCVQSFNATPLDTMRAAIADFAAEAGGGVEAMTGTHPA